MELRQKRLPAAAVSVIAIVAVLSGCNRSSDTAGSDAGVTKLASVATNDIAKNPDMQSIAMTGGKALYAANCSSCHGADLKGAPDAHTPDLTDNEWLYIGDDPDSGG